MKPCEILHDKLEKKGLKAYTKLLQKETRSSLLSNLFFLSGDEITYRMNAYLQYVLFFQKGERRNTYVALFCSNCIITCFQLKKEPS
jgi:hypothetical protein